VLVVFVVGSEEERRGECGKGQETEKKSEVRPLECFSPHPAVRACWCRALADQCVSRVTGRVAVERRGEWR
jgi:hypothetical protein